MQFLTNTNIDFLSKKKIFMGLSLLLIGAGIVSLIVKGGPNYSVDFRGGQIVEVHIEPAVPVGDVRNILLDAGIPAQQVQRFGAPEEILIYLPTGQDEAIESGERTIAGILQETMSDRTVELRREEKVGPKIGRELRAAAVNAILVALTLIILYISIRFVFQFGLAAVVTLAHDVLITIGIFSILNKEISLVTLAAFLTIIGYSLNDTIIVFDRIRENMSLRRKETYQAVVNKSINETLSRTVITSGTTLLAAMALYLFGGPVIHDFAIAMLIGIVVGTYSSIYVASPIVIAWYNWRSSDRRRTGRAGAARANS
jgi:preprotein translocase subunit SecF